MMAGEHSAPGLGAGAATVGSASMQPLNMQGR